MAEDYKKRFFDSLDTLESEQKKFRAIEAGLKRLMGRLCVASLGQSSRLDDELKKLQTALRKDAATDELDKIATAITDAINVLDQPVVSEPVATASKPPPSSNEPIVDDERIRAILSALISELRRDPELIIPVDALDAKFAASLTRAHLPDVLSSLTDLVGRRIQRIEKAKQEVEALLGDMVGKLDEIGQFVLAQNQNQSQSLASSESLNTQLVGEMKAMGASVETAVDLTHVRSQVRSRLDSIDKHLQEFRQRETARATEMSARNQRMQERVTQLEAEANRLHNQLKNEQRQSTLDALTKIPNRLAYEKRLDEELKRFARFKQPTCIAVWDVDHFKKINDGFGHRAGDKVLCAVAECLATRIRSTDFFARYGGEEFVMILCGAKLNDALRIIEEMRVAVTKIKMHSNGTPLAVTISIGVTELLPADTAGGVFERADKAMYQAKESGRNRSVGV